MGCLRSPFSSGLLAFVVVALFHRALSRCKRGGGRARPALFGRTVLQHVCLWNRCSSKSNRRPPVLSEACAHLHFATARREEKCRAKNKISVEHCVDQGLAPAMEALTCCDDPPWMHLLDMRQGAALCCLSRGRSETIYFNSVSCRSGNLQGRLGTGCANDCVVLGAWSAAYILGSSCKFKAAARKQLWDTSGMSVSRCRPVRALSVWMNLVSPAFVRTRPAWWTPRPRATLSFVVP